MSLTIVPAVVPSMFRLETRRRVFLLYDCVSRIRHTVHTVGEFIVGTFAIASRNR